jgi:hypothetical protein
MTAFVYVQILAEIATGNANRKKAFQLVEIVCANGELSNLFTLFAKESLLLLKRKFNFL